MQVLVLEASTASVKAMVYSQEKGIETVITLPYDEKTGDVAVQDTLLVYESLIAAGRQAAEGREIAAIGLGGIWHGLVVCDEGMNPVTPTYTWAYMGAAKYAARLRADEAFTRRAYHTTGCMVHAIYPAYRMAYLKECGLDTKGKRIAGQGSFNFYRLTGERLTTQSMKSGSGFLNIHTLDYDEDILKLSGIRKEQLGMLCTHNDVRPLRKDAAEALGVAPGIPVVPAMADGALNQVGSGALRPGRMTFSVGTSAALRMTADRPVIPEVPSTWCYYTAGRHLCGAATSGATNCVDWYMKNILGGCMSYADLEKTIGGRAEAPFFLPFLFGERCPGWRDDRKGGFYGLTGHTGTGEQYYAVLEGVLFNLYQCYRELVKITGEPETIFVSGGICHSELWLRMLTDLFQKEITLLSNEQASLIGGAVLALAAAGAIANIEDFALETQRVISPEPGNAALYRQRYEKYLELYKSCI